MYTVHNYRTKKALKEDVKAGKDVKVFQPGPFGGNTPVNGTVVIEGPHYPEPHRFYAECIVKDSKIVKVK